jgi:hypothetical protein
MVFGAWCACQDARIRINLRTLYYDIQRRRFRREWEAEKDRMFARVLASFGPAIARDIREWRVEE